MESKFAFRAKSVFQNVAAKAERVFTEIKADFVTELSLNTQGKGELPWVGKSEHAKNFEDECRTRILDISKNTDFLNNGLGDGRIDIDVKSAQAVLQYDENLRELLCHYVPKLMKEKDFWKRYFAAVEKIKQDLTLRSNAPEAAQPETPQKDLVEEGPYKKTSKLVVAIAPSTVIRRLASAIEFGRSFETMKDLASHGNTEKEYFQGNDWLKKLSMKDKKSKAGRYHSLLGSLFDADRQYEENFFTSNKSTLPTELHGAPPLSFVSQLAETICGLKTEQNMAEFWIEIVKECRRRWEDSNPIPHIPKEANPNLNYCLLFQHLQVINCCIARRNRRSDALESLNADHGLYAKLKDGTLLPRLCVDRPAENLNMLETGEPVYSPITQEGPVLTEDLIKETEELVLRTGSFGAGCSHLFSDMQAFKAANPGCILEDFVRWYSPPDWREEPKQNETQLSGSLSTRMNSEGNLWKELWFSARPVPAVSQAPLFDEELAGESTLESLETIVPADFFEQLFISALTAGFAIAEAGSLASKEPLKKFLKECRDYILSTCHKHMDSTTLENLCEVYELMETAVHVPPEELSETKSESKTVSIHLTEIRRFLQKKQTVEEQTQQRQQKTEKTLNSVVKFLESSKASLFDRKASKQQHQVCTPESEDWTIV